MITAPPSGVRIFQKSELNQILHITAKAYDTPSATFLDYAKLLIETRETKEVTFRFDESRYLRYPSRSAEYVLFYEKSEKTKSSKAFFKLSRMGHPLCKACEMKSYEMDILKKLPICYLDECAQGQQGDMPSWLALTTYLESIGIHREGTIIKGPTAALAAAICGTADKTVLDRIFKMGVSARGAHIGEAIPGVAGNPLIVSYASARTSRLQQGVLHPRFQTMAWLFCHDRLPTLAQVKKELLPKTKNKCEARSGRE